MMMMMMIRLNTTKEVYINQDWYKDLKSRWSNYFDTLEKHWLKMYFRYEFNSEFPKKSIPDLLMC